jgi:hypothetical protein
LNIRKKEPAKQQVPFFAFNPEKDAQNPCHHL